MAQQIWRRDGFGRLVRTMEFDKESSQSTNGTNSNQSSSVSIEHERSQSTEIINLPDRELMSIRFHSTQSATNDRVDMFGSYDFVSWWNAELFVHRFDIPESTPKLRKVFPELKADDYLHPHRHITLATANYWIVSMERLNKVHGLDPSIFFHMMCSVEPLEDLLEIMDYDDPGIFKRPKRARVGLATKSGRSGYEDDDDQEMDDDDDNMPDAARRVEMMNEFGPQENIIFIQNVKVKDNMRGHHLGRNLVQRILDNFGVSCSRVVLKPWPLQWSGRASPQTKQEMQQFRRDRNKVIRVWESMGFRQIGYSQYWGRCQANRHPMETFD